MKNILKIEDLNVSYGPLQVVFDVNLTVDKGECVALLGANGAGKSTIINSICGVVKPSSGKIYVEDKEIQDLPTYKRIEYGVSVVPEGRRLFPYLTVTENLLLASFRLKDRERVLRLMEYVFELFPQLKERKNNLAYTLSGGEQQMLAIGRALMSSAKIILVDEPSTGLAPKIIKQLFDTLKTLREEGMSILLAEQNIYYALNIADRGYLLRHGRIVLEGRMEDFLKNQEKIREAYIGL